MIIKTMLFTFFNDVIQFIIQLLPYILPFLWLCAITVYVLKFFIPDWDKFTRFGKLEETNSRIRVPTLSNKMGWIIFYSFSCLMFFATFFIKYPPKYVNYLLSFHSFRRLIESVFLTKFSERRMHFINLLAGLCFYVMAPVTLAHCQTSQNILLSRIVIFVALFLNFLQFKAHLILASLKKYSIPKNWLFTVCTSPHYLIEILLYFTYFITSPHYLTLLMLSFVVLNLTHQAKLTHQWYTEKFGFEFTSLHRFVVFPYLY